MVVDQVAQGALELSDGKGVSVDIAIALEEIGRFDRVDDIFKAIAQVGFFACEFRGIVDWQNIEFCSGADRPSGGGQSAITQLSPNDGGVIAVAAFIDDDDAIGAVEGIEANEAALLGIAVGDGMTVEVRG